jgi:type IV secretory pathway VirB4 component
VISIKTINYAILSKDAQDSLRMCRHNYFKKMAEQNAHIRIFTIRNKKFCSTTGKYPHKILQLIHDVWMSRFNNIFENRNYFVISARPYKKGFSSDEKLVVSTMGHLKKLVAITYDMLADYNPEVLRHDEISPLLSFWARLVIFQDIPISEVSNINSAISSSNLEFLKDGSIQLPNKIIKVLNIGIWGESCDFNVLNEILRINSEAIIYHSLKGRSKMSAMNTTKFIKSLPSQMRQAYLSFDSGKAVSQYEEFIQIIKNDEASLYEYQLTIFVESDTHQKCLETVNQIKRIFYKQGINPIQAVQTVKYLYLSMLPSNEQQIYPAKLLSSIIAYWLQFSGDAKGLARSSWGEGAIREFETANRERYALQLHVSEMKKAVAHSVTFGKTGKGKTLLWQHLIGGAIRLGVKGFILDRLDGTKIFTNAVGGQYVTLNNKLNPFVCDDTPENRTFIYQLLMIMGNCDDSASREQLCYVLNGIFAIPKSVRVLNDIVSDIVPEGDLKRELSLWTGDNPFSCWFNGINIHKEACDSLDLSNSYLVTFDMTKIQENPIVSACVTFYIMQRIKQEVNNGIPHIVFIDEAAPQLRSRLFRENVHVMFNEHRKKEGSINIAFQDGKSLIDSGIETTVNEQCATKFFFTNKEANKKNFSKLNLTEYEWSYIKEELPISPSLKRSVLVKKENESVILNIDMAGMGELLKIYSSGGDDVKLSDELRQTYGQDRWVKEYLVRTS